jgi:hypothetical protein
MADPKKENQEKDRQMDEMLDSLLAAYSSAEPRPGLETRILASLRDAPSREASPAPWNFKWLWTGAAIAAAIIVGAALLVGHRNDKAPVVVQKSPAPVQPQSEQTQQNTPQIMPEIATHPRESRPHGATAPPAVQNSGLALGQRLAIFPTPTPLSEQERLMLAYLANTPHEEIIAQTQRDEKEADAFWGDRDTSPEIPAPVNPTRR